MTTKKDKKEDIVKKNSFLCQRCSGRMQYTKFYYGSSAFFGWHCLICGDIIDPVILLHRLTQNANIKIPETEAGIMHLLRHTLKGRTKEKTK